MAKEKTDLSKILAVSGYPGLYRYVAQSRTGAIAEALATGTRVNFPANGKITTLEDISIYTDEGELKLREVFLLMTKSLGTADAPSAKDKDEVIRACFEKAVPSYDKDRFYLSHMKKVVTWYNELKAHASLDFVDPDKEEAPKEEKPVKETAAKEKKAVEKPVKATSAKKATARKAPVKK